MYKKAGAGLVQSCCDWRRSWKGAVTVNIVVVQGERPSAWFGSHAPWQWLWWLQLCIHCYSAFHLPPLIHSRTQPQHLETWPWSCGTHVWAALAAQPISPLSKLHLSTMHKTISWIHRKFRSIHDILHDILHDIRQTWFRKWSLPWKRAKIHDQWHEFIKNHEFSVPRRVLSNNLYQSSYMNSWKIMNSYMNSWKKHMN